MGNRGIEPDAFNLVRIAPQHIRPAAIDKLRHAVKAIVEKHIVIPRAQPDRAVEAVIQGIDVPMRRADEAGIGRDPAAQVKAIGAGAVLHAPHIAREVEIQARVMAGIIERGGKRVRALIIIGMAQHGDPARIEVVDAVQ